MPLTTAQKNLVAQFCQATGANEKAAQRFLKNANYKLDVAADASSGGNTGAFNAPRPEPALEKMFDGLHDESRDEKDTLDVESSMMYFQSLGIDPETADFFVVAEIVQAESFGRITKKNYVDGWKNTGIPARDTDHIKYVESSIKRLATDPDYFKKVYRYGFIAGRDENQRALPLERAEVFWDMLFAPHIHPWQTPGVDWLEAWKTFLEEKYNKTVSKDMWNQTLEFADRTVAAGGLSFWDENSSWPTVIDQFVEYCSEKKIGGGGAADGMEVD
ncbi:hypothetical protein GQ53DRAFT_362909 [Thozetella sp. PMI_491]|nr:hypothetical protein GQ53DRAFT_362909 [Thozetella sp. PMI_491]